MSLLDPGCGRPRRVQAWSCVIACAAMLAAGCDRSGVPRLDQLEARTSPPIADRAEYTVAGLRITIERGQRRVRTSSLQQHFDVRIENFAGVRVAGCLRVAAVRAGTEIDDDLIGQGWLEHGATALHRDALVITQESGVLLREDALVWFGVPAEACPKPPNVVVILADDLGYADVSFLGGLEPATPNIDRLGAEGLTFDAFHAAPSCTPARAELMTGSYARRVGVPTFYGPVDTKGLHPDEVTIAELVTAYGYRTALVGKWHLGSAPQFRPTAQGFDEYFGVLYSHDLTNRQNPFFPSLRLFEGDDVVEVDPDLTRLTERFTARAVRFIEENAEGPFLLYVAHVVPHVPLAPSPDFAGTSGLGPYADVLLELDASVGRVLDALASAGIDGNTIVLFASDNGPWLRYGNHAGLAEPFREGKLTSFEGGVRVPAFLRWPDGVGAPRRSGAIAGLIDVLPTLAELVAAPLPANRVIDGASLMPVIEDRAFGTSLRDVHVIHFGGQLQTVRRGDFKLTLPHTYQGVVTAGEDGAAGVVTVRSVDEIALHDVAADPSQAVDLVVSQPEVAADLSDIADAVRLDLGDDVLGIPGIGRRPEGGAGS